MDSAWLRPPPAIHSRGTGPPVADRCLKLFTRRLPIMRRSLVNKRNRPIREQAGILGIDLTSVAGSGGISRTAIQHMDLLRDRVTELEAEPNGLIHEPPCGIIATNYAGIIQRAGLMSKLMALRFAERAKHDRTIRILDGA